MTDTGRVPLAVRTGAVLVTAVTVVGTLLTWRTTITRATPPSAHPAWTSGAWPATGAVLAVVGVAGLLVATWAARGRTARLGGSASAVVTVAGVVTLLADRFRPVGLASVTYAYAVFERPDPIVEALPDATAWVTAAGLGALVVAGAVFPSRTGVRGPHRPGLLVAVVGAVVLVVGASAFPWSSGLPTREAASLWHAGDDAVTGAVLLLLGAVVLVATAWRPVRGAAVASGLLAAAGLGIVLPQRLPNPWGDRTAGWYAYQPLETIAIPPAWRFQAATTLVLLGAVLVLVAAVLVARRPATAGPETT